jgi:polygalacturonase
MNIRRDLLSTSLLFALAPLAFAAPPANPCDPRTYGAKADGSTLDTAAIQKAIDTCSANGGATVELTAGTYLSAPLTLRSHTHLKLDAGAVLLGSKNKDDYPVRTEPENNWRRLALLHADNISDFSLTGVGTVDGQGSEWWDWSREGDTKHDTSGNAQGRTRPMLFDIVKSSDILIDGVTLQNSPMYNLFFVQSHDIAIKRIKIRNPTTSHNTDGIDPLSSYNIAIDHVSIDTGDDCVAIKSGLVERGEPNIPSHDISISNSDMLHGHGLSVGSELAGGAYNISVSNVAFKDTEAGIRIKSNRTRGNDIYNLSYSNLSMSGVKVPILITEYYPHIPVSDTPQPMADHTPRFKNISITNLAAQGADTAMTIAGTPESPIRNLTLMNVAIRATKPATIMYADVTEKNVAITAATTPTVVLRDGANVQQIK